MGENINIGPNASFSGAAIGPNAQVNIGPLVRKQQAEWPGERDHQTVGVLTALTVERRSIVRALMSGGAVAEVSAVETDCDVFSLGALRVVVLQTRSPGQSATVAAADRLHKLWLPSLVAFVGIAGAIDRTLRLGDVIIATEVIEYESRKITADGDQRQMKSWPTTGMVQDHVNGFMAHRQERGGGPGDTRIIQGPIGSGEAVIAVSRSDIVHDLIAMNRKVLAVETEGAGLARAFHEWPKDEQPDGWLIIRGISDYADELKDDGAHELAASNAANVFRGLLEYQTPRRAGSGW